VCTILLLAVALLSAITSSNSAAASTDGELDIYRRTYQGPYGTLELEEIPASHTQKEDCLRSNWDCIDTMFKAKNSEDSKMSLGLNFYMYQPVVVNGHYLKSNDAVCLGDELKMPAKEVEGEWFTKGGPLDTPPVRWGRRVEGEVFCQKNCQESITGGLEELGSTSYEVTSEDKIKVSGGCSFDCEYNCDIYRVPISSSISQRYELRVKDSRRGSVSTTSSNVPTQVIGPFNVRVEISNQQNSVVKLRDIDSNLPSYDVLYAPDALEPGSSDEIILKGRLERDTNAKVNLTLYSKKLGCSEAKTFTKAISLGQIERKELKKCDTDADCSEQQTCCLDRCHDSLKGTCDDIDGDGGLEWAYY